MLRRWNHNVLELGARDSEEVKVKGGKREGGRINGMCNLVRDVPAGVHVHDYRRTGERE